MPLYGIQVGARVFALAYWLCTALHIPLYGVHPFSHNQNRELLVKTPMGSLPSVLLCVRAAPRYNNNFTIATRHPLSY